MRRAVDLLPATSGLAAFLSIALVAVKTWRQPSFSHAPPVAALSLSTLATALIVWAALRRSGDPPSSVDADGATAWLLGLQIGLLLLTIPVFVLVKGTAADLERWTWPFLNKRWLVALYFVAVAAVVICPVACRAWLAESTRERTPATSTATKRRFVHVNARTAIVAIALAWYFAGPPWHLDRHHRDIEYHEQVHLGPLQAIAKGYVPYLGPASTQYGPGTQALIFGVMRLSTHFDLASFRTAWALMNLTAFIVVALVAACWLEPLPGVLVMLVSVAYSPFAVYGTQADGTLSGFYGWANALRYLAPLVVVPTLLRLAGTRWVVALGVVWGLGAWIAQENLSSTALGAGLLLLLLGLTRTVSAATVFRSARDLCLGFCVVAVPVVLYYAYHDAAGTFVEHYLALPRAVSSGFQNTSWPRGDSAIRTFFMLPVVLIALSVVSLWNLRTLRLGTPLDDGAAVLLAFVCVQLVCYPVALLRTDGAHLQNTTIALPFVLVLAAQHLPRLLGARHRAAIRWGFVAFALAWLPAGRILKAREILVTPYTRFVSASAPAGSDPRVAYAHARPSDQPFDVNGRTISFRSWLDFADEVRGVVGNRRTYVAAIPAMTSGALYFFADLTPAPVPRDTDTMILTERDHQRVVDDIRAHPDRYEAFVGRSLDTTDARAFLETHPAATRVDRQLDGETVHILVSASDRK